MQAKTLRSMSCWRVQEFEDQKQWGVRQQVSNLAPKTFCDSCGVGKFGAQGFSIKQLSENATPESIRIEQVKIGVFLAVWARLVCKWLQRRKECRDVCQMRLGTFGLLASVSNA